LTASPQILTVLYKLHMCTTSRTLKTDAPQGDVGFPCKMARSKGIRYARLPSKYLRYRMLEGGDTGATSPGGPDSSSATLKAIAPQPRVTPSCRMARSKSYTHRYVPSKTPAPPCFTCCAIANAPQGCNMEYPRDVFVYFSAHTAPERMVGSLLERYVRLV
jgi:hypothetical protein